MSNCLFCDDFVGEVNGDGGTKGFTIGTRDICKACLQELKYRLNQVEARSPMERENISDGNTIEKSRDGDQEEQDPFRAKATDDE